ncbi:MAG: PilZ domain-containing protein [Candidatus Omnitrophica bacterium]|nr:PilZ domain-containing protein [Candidatus Omnitrophota bacterium]MBU1128752.1 PilZ domain-containing protein [Candidatus Omnitrophota bacterium]MBU1657048.1 PilZ domain-containing protein [Candidatus Omnitrophota bacterium]MBU1783976.1 PilZ domain-containing protein [Candidatus Omnitrophota bacterium]MBU1851255.1 PilZ domain-containing protein [Candidatus Omnitrophota bacterium]
MLWEGIDKRKFPRINYRCRIRVSSRGKEEVFETFTENIGVGGICVILRKEFDLFKTANLDLYLSEKEGPISCQGTIVWVIRRKLLNKKDVNEYDVGIEFTDIADKDKVKIAGVVNDVLTA